MSQNLGIASGEFLKMVFLKLRMTSIFEIWGVLVNASENQFLFGGKKYRKQFFIVKNEESQRSRSGLRYGFLDQATIYHKTSNRRAPLFSNHIRKHLRIFSHLFDSLERLKIRRTCSFIRGFTVCSFLF
jgi:hypothetical protein